MLQKDKYLQEMQDMVRQAITNMQHEIPNYQIYTASIWTDADAQKSAISFDSKENSDARVTRSNQWFKERGREFDESEDRNCSPADFALRNYVLIDNFSFPSDWEHDSEGVCWNSLEPVLKEIGVWAFEELKKLNLHPKFELGVNGRSDWYEFTWSL